jgi:hypothetical protein
MAIWDVLKRVREQLENVKKETENSAPKPKPKGLPEPVAPKPKSIGSLLKESKEMQDKYKKIGE